MATPAHSLMESQPAAKMKRREFVALLGGVVAWPFAVWDQQPAKVARIGYLVTGSFESPEVQATITAFRQGLRELGYVEGQNILIEYRAADGKYDRLPGLARELKGAIGTKGRHSDNITMKSKREPAAITRSIAGGPTCLPRLVPGRSACPDNTV